MGFGKFADIPARLWWIGCRKRLLADLPRFEPPFVRMTAGNLSDIAKTVRCQSRLQTGLLDNPAPMRLIPNRGKRFPQFLAQAALRYAAGIRRLCLASAPFGTSEYRHARVIEVHVIYTEWYIIAQEKRSMRQCCDPRSLASPFVPPTRLTERAQPQPRRRPRRSCRRPWPRPPSLA